MGQTTRQSLERRSFLRCVAMATAGLPFSGGGIDASGVPARQPPAGTWASQMGFALFTVRDLLAKDADGTMAALATMGIREVQPRTYLGLDHGAFRALLDRHGLNCRSTHEFSIPGPGLDWEFESLQKIGIKYARFPVPASRSPGAVEAEGRARDEAVAVEMSRHRRWSRPPR